MPQLDKYIFFNQIVYLTFFFSLIYIYIRGTVVPKLSTLLKYRKKRVDLFSEQIEGYSKVLNFSKSIFEREGKIFVNYLLEKITLINNSYKKINNIKFLNIFNNLNSHFRKVTENKGSILKNKIELNRLSKLSKI